MSASRGRVDGMRHVTSHVVALAFAIVFAGIAFAQPANYVDPAGYPATWPADFTPGCTSCFAPYTYKGLPATDPTGSSDRSTGGTTPQSNADIVVDDNGVSTYYSGDGTNLYFRLTLNGPPGSLTGSGQPYTATNWSILIDVNGDAYRDFAVMVFGADGGAQPDDVLVLYNNTKSQSVSTAVDAIWRQDSARHPTLANTVDGEPNDSSVWDVNPDPYVWNFSRTRIVQLNRSVNVGNQNSRYYLDVQVPLAALDATSRGGPRLTPTSFIQFAYTTANSNTNPAQKDFGFPGDYAFTDVNQPLPYGDDVTPGGATTQKPILSSVTAGTCTSSTLLTAQARDTTEAWGSNQLRTTVRRVEFYYLFDANSNGVVDAGETWVLISPPVEMSVTPTSTTVTGGTVTDSINPWNKTWNPTSLVKGRYLIKAIAYDDQSNVSDSSQVSGTTANPGGLQIASFENSCGAPAADLSIAKSASPTPLVAGQTVTYTLAVGNAGPDAATSVTVTDNLPSSVAFVSCSVTGGVGGTCAGSGNNRTITFTSVPAGAGTIATITLVATVLPSIADGASIANSASIAAATIDPNTANNASTISTAVVRRADLSVVKSASPSPVTAGTDITYTLTVVNNGPSDAAGVRVSDNLNASHAFVSCTVVSGPSGTCGGTANNRFVDFASFPASATATIRIVARVLSSVPGGSSLPNTASVSATTTDPNAANNSSSTSVPVIARADLSLSKTASPEPAVAGAVLTYTVGVSNLGPSDATSVAITDPLPAGLAFVSCTITSGPTGDCVHASGTVTASYSTLASGGSATLSLVVRLPASWAAGATFTNTATGSSAVTDPVSSNNAASAGSTVARRSDLLVSKQVDLAVPIRGDQVQYTVTVTNQGPSDASGVSISDPLPAEVSFTSSSGCAESTAGGVPTCTLGAIAAGTSVNVTIVASVKGDAALGASVTNTASIATSDSPDPVPGNNAGSATFTVSGLQLAKSACNLSTSSCSSPADFTDSELAGEPGETVAYRIAYQNFGGPIFDVVMQDELPAQATLQFDTYVGGTEVELVCPNGDVVYLGQASDALVTVDLVLACTLDTATDSGGNVREALLPGQSGSFTFLARID